MGVKIFNPDQIISYIVTCYNKKLIEFAVYGIIEQLKTVNNNPSYISQLRKSNNHRKFISLKQQFPIYSALDGSKHLNLPHD